MNGKNSKKIRKEAAAAFKIDLQKNLNLLLGYLASAPFKTRIKVAWYIAKGKKP